MLEGLKDVQWAELSHAYGSASDVPAILRALAADDEETRKGAIYTLFTNIYHQGTVYQASAYAVPFLLELLAHNSVQGKDEILLLLAHMAGGDGYIHQHLPLSEPKPVSEDSEVDQFQEELDQWLSPEKLYGSDYEQKMEEEISWVRKTYKAIVEGADLYFSLLEHSDINVKMNAAFLLAHLPGLSNRVIPLFYTLFEKEEDERVKGNLIAILGWGDKRSSRCYQWLKHLAFDDSVPLLRFVASLAIVRSRREDIPHEVIDFLIQVALDKRIVDEESYNQIQAEGGKVSISSCYALRWLESQPATYAIHQLLAAFHACLKRFEEESGYDLQQYRASRDFWLAWDTKQGAGRDPVVEENMDNPWVAMLDGLRWTRPSIIEEVRNISETLVSLGFREKIVEPDIRFHDLSETQQLILRTLLDCPLAWRDMGGHRVRMTGRWNGRMGCVANLECIGFSHNYFNADQQEGLRAFIEQGKTIKEWLAEHRQQVMKKRKNISQENDS